MPPRWTRATRAERLERGVNCPSAENLRLRLVSAHRKGDHQTIVDLSGTALRCVRAQYQGEDPLTVNVAATALLLMGRERAAAALDELGEPAGCAAIVRPAEGCVRDVMTAHAAILRALAHLEGDFAAAISDGDLSEDDRSDLIGALREVQSRCSELETRLGGRSR